MPSSKRPTFEILVADDYEVYRRGLCAVITAHPGWAVSAECGNGRDAVAEAVRLRPHLALIDVAMPEMSGTVAARQIRAACPDTDIILLAHSQSERLTLEVDRVGAIGYLQKSIIATDLVSAILVIEARRHSRRTRTVDGASTTVAADQATADIALQSRLHGIAGSLTAREREVLRMLADGATSVIIATALGISRRTVDAHRGNLMSKLGARTALQLIRTALAAGLLTIT